MDLAHPRSLVNATINGCSHLGKDKLFNRMPPCGYPCPSCRTLSAAAFSPSQQQDHCSTPTALTHSSSISSTSGQLEPMVYHFFGQIFPNYPHLSFHHVTKSIVEGLECPRTCPCALSIKSLEWLCHYLLTKASSTTLGYLAQSLTLGHSTACFLFLPHTAESRWRGSGTLQSSQNTAAPATPSGPTFSVWYLALPDSQLPSPQLFQTFSISLSPQQLRPLPHPHR